MNQPASIVPLRVSFDSDRLWNGDTVIHGIVECYGRDRVISLQAGSGISCVEGYVRGIVDGDPVQRFVVRVPAGCKVIEVFAGFRSGVSQRLFLLHAPNPEPIAATFRTLATPLDLSGVLPRISVILPTCDTDRYYLDRCLGSMLAQSYPNWELCIADDASSSEEVKARLQSLAQSDTRIKLTLREARGHISAASNTALATATGDYVCLLDHDDELHSSALGEIAALIQKQPSLRIVYTDEDKIDDLGRRHQPTSKPDFDLNWLTCMNYLGHLVCIQTELVRTVGGFRSEVDGAQDWDLLLRCVEQTDQADIGHIPKVLYHWRAHAGSTALTLDAKPYVRSAWRKVLESYVERNRLDARVEQGCFDGSMRLRFQAPELSRVAVALSAEEGRQVFRKLGGKGLKFFRVGDFPPDDVDVILHISSEVDTVSPLFVQELAAQASRPSVAMVCGRVDSEDPLVVRRISEAHTRCFGVNRAVAGGGAFDPKTLVQRVNAEAKLKALELISTPYAMALKASSNV